MSVQGAVRQHPNGAAAAAASTSVSTPATQNGAIAPAAPGAAAQAQTSGLGEIRDASLGAEAGRASAIKPVLKGLGPGGIKGAAKRLSPRMTRALAEFEIAKDAFKGFCQQWHQTLVDRRVNNVNHIDWKMKNGVETGTYVGYGPIKSCVCKEAENGIPVGDLTYNELDYTVTGKTKGQAKAAKPSVSVVPTREIFSWDKGKWFY
jgi:hypothetical protein